MTQPKSIKKNMIMSILLTTSNFVFPLITYSYVSRVLSPIGTGKVAFVNSILQYFLYVSALGIPTYGMRECAKVRDDSKALSHLVQELLIINIVSTTISYLLLLGATAVVPRLYAERKLIAIMGMNILFNTMGMEWVYSGLEEYAYITKRSLIIKCIAVGLTFVLIHTKEDYLLYGLVTTFTSSASYIWNFFHIRKHIDFKKHTQYNFKKHIKPIFVLFSAAIIITIYSNFDVSMLGFISTEQEVGLYNAALKIEAVILSLSTAITSVLVPRISYHISSGETGQVESLLEKSIRISLILALPIAIYVFLFAENCILLICGEEYLNAANTLRILMICIAPLILTNLFGNQILIPSGNEKRYSQSVFVGLWINLTLNIILIPYLGAFGAAIGTLITEIWNVIWMASGTGMYAKTIVKCVKFAHYIIPLTLASFFVCMLNVKIQSYPLLIKLLITGSLYLAIYYGLLLITKEPIIQGQIKSVFSKLRIRLK